MNLFRKITDALNGGQPKPPAKDAWAIDWDALPPGFSPLDEGHQGPPEQPGQPEQPEFDAQHQSFLTFPIPPDDVLNLILFGKSSIFRDIVGQDQAKRRLARAVFDSWKRHASQLPSGEHQSDHLFTTNILLEGPTSTGKTTIARQFVKEGLCIPLCEINGAKIKTAAEILFEIAKTLLDWDKEWRERGGGQGDPIGLTLVELPDQQFYPPPMVVFIDEAHRLPKPLQDLLLKALEANDRMLDTENGYKVDCRRVSWILATTNRGQLIDTLDNRCRKIKLRLYSREEVAEIVKIAHPKWGLNLCRLIAHYTPRVPREALDFAAEVAQEKRRNPSLDWKQAAANVAEDSGIDQWGMTQERRDILRVLGQEGPMSLARLAAVAQCDEETCRDRVLAPLTTSTPGEPALVGVMHKHFITPAGLKELDKRGIRHLGRKAMPPGHVGMQEGTDCVNDG